ncbi:sugar phosphate isomerase/epimerase family protein [Enemella sp. A6]|uniref:sugar phosphate isomerase/epimerase family protein n=1 Tax=Enemella sp. A6 TaxID=3440152 RepID=UPI003EBB047B
MSSSPAGWDLVLAAYTLDGADLTERVEATAAAGFAGLSLRPPDIGRALAAGWTISGIAALLDEHGLVVADLDALARWAPHHWQHHGLLPADHDFDTMEQNLWTAAAGLGARSVNVVDMGGRPVPVADLAEGFARACDRAAEFGLLAHLEPLGGSAVPTIAVAAEVSRLAGRPNGGVILDTWHHFRSGGTPSDLAAVADQILAVQINDAPATAEPNMFAETMHRRLLPGEGDAEVAATLAELHRLGVSVPISVEVMSDRLRALPPREAARLAAEAGRAVLPDPD